MENVPEGLFYTKEHEWVKIDGKTATAGITDHAQKSLGDITFVELPVAGRECAQFKQLASVESVKAASDVYAPLSGRVTEVNSLLSEKPELINRSPYGEGWFVKMEAKDISEKNNLMHPEAYRKYVEESAG